MKIILYISSILLAFFIHKTVTHSETTILTILLMFLALGLYLFGVIYLAYSLTNIFIPIDKETQDRYHAWRNNKTKLLTLFDTKTLKRLKLQKAISLICMVVFIFGFGSIYFTWLSNWTDNEIQDNYVERRVVIKSISWAKGRYADFEFEFNNKLIQDRTQNSYLQVGDSITISFSSKNPKILRVNYDRQ